MNPDLKWYMGISKRKGLVPRCPFASLDRCPRFYQSVSLLGEAGSTKIDPDEDKRLFEKWRSSDLWPVTGEQESSTLGPEGKPKDFWNFCPEVSFERFGLFASDLDEYDDEIHVEQAHSRLAQKGARPDDPRWHWWRVVPAHYSECPLYSLLAGGGSQPKETQSIGLRP